MTMFALSFLLIVFFDLLTFYNLAMGAYLSKPEKGKSHEEGENGSVRFASTSMQGWRTHQEDAHNCIVDFADECSFFAVYDGHGGSEVSTYLKKNFPDFLKEHRMLEQQQNPDALISTLQKLFVKFDDILRRDETVKIMTDLKAANSTTIEHCQSKECDREEKERTERENLIDEVHALSQESNVNIEHIFKQYAKCHNFVFERVTGAAADQPQNHPNSENELDSKRERKKRPIVFISPQLRKRSKIQSAAEDENVERQIGECTLSINNENCKTIEQKGSENEGHKEHSPTKNRADGEATNNLNGSSAIDKCKEAQIEPSSGEQKKRDRLERQNSPNEENGHATGGTKTNADGAIKPPHSSALDDKANQNVGAGGEDDEEEDDPDYNEESGAVEGEETTSSEGEEESEEGESEEAEDEDDGEEEELEMLFNSSEGNKAGFDSGSTACVALLFKGQFVVANIGDSRCVLCRAGKAVDLSADHKPEDLKEKERIEAAGGSVSDDGRVNGGLNLTRAFGDHFYKQTERLPLKDQMITALPDVTITERDGETDDFIIVACDGIWNSMTSQEACDFVLARIGTKSLKDIGADMCDFCCAKDTTGDGSGCDNETIIIIDLKKEARSVSCENFARPEASC